MAGSERIGVIDLGSNSIRLVVYERLGRTPVPFFNEKVLCGLGRDLARTGRLHPEGRAQALANLKRFARLLEGMAVGRVDVLATAAVRDASDGESFVAEVRRACGLDVEIVSGAEEARLAALGVLSGQPGADGVMGDLGGGSLELVGLDAGTVAEQVTLPLGPFRLMGHPGGRGGARQLIAELLAGQPWLGRYRGRTFHPVGGNWRALAKVLMSQRKHPLHIIHQYEAPARDVAQLAGLIAGQGRLSLERLPGVSKRRLETLPYAAMVFEGVLEALRPARVVFSAYGMREGHLFDLLTPEQQAEDPLLHAAAAFSRRLDRFGHAEVIAAWTAGLFPREDPGLRRLRQAACLLSDIGWAEHPDYRAEHAFLRTLRLPIPGLEHGERAFLAVALYARYGGSPGDRLTQPFVALMPETRAGEAAQLGLVLRLGHSITGGASGLLARTRLVRTAREIMLWLPRDEEALIGDMVGRRLDAVARALGLDARIVVSDDAEAVAGL